MEKNSLPELLQRLELKRDPTNEKVETVRAFLSSAQNEGLLPQISPQTLPQAPSFILEEFLEASGLQHGNLDEEFLEQVRILISAYESESASCSAECEKAMERQKNLILQLPETVPGFTEGAIWTNLSQIQKPFLESQEKLVETLKAAILQVYNATGRQSNKRIVKISRSKFKFTEAQNHLLEEWFLNHPYPTEKEKQQLADQIEEPVERVKNWFQNKRARSRKQGTSIEQPSNTEDATN